MPSKLVCGAPAPTDPVILKCSDVFYRNSAPGRPFAHYGLYMENATWREITEGLSEKLLPPYPASDAAPPDS